MKILKGLQCINGTEQATKWNEIEILFALRLKVKSNKKKTSSPSLHRDDDAEKS